MTKVPTGGSAPTSLDVARVEADLLLGLAKGGRHQVLGRTVLATAWKGDLTGVAPQVRAPLREHQAGVRRVAEDRHQHRRLGSAGRLHRRGLGRIEQGAAKDFVRRVHCSSIQSALEL